MNRLNDLDYLKLNKFKAFWYKLKMFLFMLPKYLKGSCLKIWSFLKRCGRTVREEAKETVRTFREGNLAVKLSFFIFGLGNFYYGQIMRGILFLLFEIIFVVYMVIPCGGIYWLAKGHWFIKGATVGSLQGGFRYDPTYDTDVWTAGDDSVKVLLYGLLTILFVFAFFYTWRVQYKQCRICMDIRAKGKKIKSGGSDLRSLLDDQFHKTLLALPLTGIFMFTVIPIIYMVLIAFTNYDAAHDGYANLFSWVGLDNFNELLDFGNGGLGLAFGEVLAWTLMWAVFATFTNYFLGIFVAMIINKKGIRFKKLWRTVFVMTIAIPPFVSLLYVSKLFDGSGILGKLLVEWNLLPSAMINASQFSLWQNPISARILVILINIWIGIPHTMLIATGILMNIPNDLYESSRIDGAGPIQQYRRITLPYMMFVMGPYLLTTFVGNLNNFNVIYLLTQNNQLINTEIGTAGGVSVNYTDLLITWLYKMTLNSAETKYYLASIIGILVFLVVALLSLVVYNIIPSTKNEEDYR